MNQDLFSKSLVHKKARASFNCRNSSLNSLAQEWKFGATWRHFDCPRISYLVTCFRYTALGDSTKTQTEANHSESEFIVQIRGPIPLKPETRKL